MKHTIVGCTGKGRFDTPNQAHAAAQAGRGLNVYRCHTCHGYHVGHSDRPRSMRTDRVAFA